MADLPRVLMVDYDPKALRALRDLFVKSGYQVETAKDGAAALSAFKQTHPNIVLLEAMIPKKHGFEVCQEIKKTPEGRETPVIIMTAVYKGRKYRTQAMRVHGCDEYVERPCTPEALLAIVQRFVPPGPVAEVATDGRTEQAAEGSDEERLGLLIPFPSTSEQEPFSLPDFEDETEREIMSKLDEILPDTPIFDERGLGEAVSDDFDAMAVPAASVAGSKSTAVLPSAVAHVSWETAGARSSSASAASTSMVGAAVLSPEMEQDAVVEVEGFENAPVPSRGPGGAEASLAGRDHSRERSGSRAQDPRRVQAKAFLALEAEEVIKHTRSRKRAAPGKNNTAEPPTRFVSPVILVGLVLAVVAAIISYILGQV